jgi:hypothetical protein
MWASHGSGSAACDASCVEGTGRNRPVDNYDPTRLGVDERSAASSQPMSPSQYWRHARATGPLSLQIPELARICKSRSEFWGTPVGWVPDGNCRTGCGCVADSGHHETKESLDAPSCGVANADDSSTGYSQPKWGQSQPQLLAGRCSVGPGQSRPMRVKGERIP